MSNKNYCSVWILLYIVAFSIPIYGQPSEKLPATTIIGTAYSMDYANNTASTTVNTKAHVFDGDLNTYFASHAMSGTWVGLDLGEKHVITKIAYAPRNDVATGPALVLLGLFEGANEPDFSDAVPLLMITENPPQNKLTEQEIHCSKGFRYVRYVGPNNARCQIAEIEFYGYKGSGDLSQLYQLTNLPTIVISTKNTAEIASKDNFVQGYISIISDGTIYSDNLEIRGRGHASWSFPKKPYRIKLEKKANLLGLPARERNWTLVNQWGDKTLMRNLVSFDISRRLDMDYTPAGLPVDLILNGEFKGNYLLCDQIEIAAGRVETQKISADDKTLPNLSGGYLLEVDAYAYQEVSGWFSSTMLKTPVRIRSPKADEIVSQQYTYIREHYDKMEQAVFSTNYMNPLNGYRKYIDTESFIRHFLIGEITGNTDTYWSVYMYKARNSDVFKFGPAWDLDLTFDNDWRTYPVSNHSQWVYEFGSSANGFRLIVNRLFSDPDFIPELKTIYADYRKRGLISKEALIQVVDEYASLLDQSQRLNFERWKIMDIIVHENPVRYSTYEGGVNHVKKYISDRIDWMDNKLGYKHVGNMPVETNISNITVFAQANLIYINNVKEQIIVNLYNISGNVVLSKTINENTVLPVASGVYIVQIYDSKGNSKSVKCLVWG